MSPAPGLRVALVGACPYPSPQGSQVYLQGMARALQEAGTDVRVVAYAHGCGAPGSVPVVRAPALPGYGRMRSGPDLAKPLLDLGLAAALARVDVEVVHAHGHEALAVAILARGLRRAARRPAWALVYTPHTSFEEELPTYLPERLRAGEGAMGWLGRIGDRALPGRADACVALSWRSAEALRAQGARVAAIVPPGLFPEDCSLAPRAKRAAESPPVVVYAGNPDRYQDLPVLLEAFAELRGGDSPPRLRLVGASWASSADGRAVASQADEVVDTSLWPQARAAIASADLAVVPRTRCAGFPVKLLAALALGVPVIVARGSAQGLPGEHVVPDHDPRALARAIAALAPDPPPVDVPELRAKMDWSVGAGRLLEVYRAERAAFAVDSLRE